MTGYDAHRAALLDAAIAAYPSVDIADLTPETAATVRDLLVAVAFSDDLDDDVLAARMCCDRDDILRVGNRWRLRRLISLADLDLVWHVLVESAMFAEISADLTYCPSIADLRRAVDELAPVAHQPMLWLRSYAAAESGGHED